MKAELASTAGLSADLMIVNATVRTLDSNRPLAEAVAVFGNRVLAVGSQRQLESLQGPATRRIDAGRRLVLPGFNDAHVHFLSGGFQLARLDLRAARTPDEFIARVSAWAARTPAGEWILGGEWDHERWPGSSLPTRAWIDAVTPHHPVWLRRLDGHMALANSRALELARVTRATPDPPGGRVVRDPVTGEPTGLLKDAAMAWVDRVVPGPTFEQKVAAARAATGHAASLGVTSVQEVDAWEHLGVYQELARRGELRTRLYGLAPLADWEQVAASGRSAPFGDERIRAGGLKAFADGSLGSHTALFFEPYADDPAQHGLVSDEFLAGEALEDRVRRADSAGLQVAIHAIGDRANDLVLSLFERVMRQNEPRDRRFRIEHAQHLRPQDIPRLARAAVVASMQPYHAADDGRWAEKRVGPVRCQTTYAFRALLDSGAVVAFGSDWTVAPLDPLQGIAAAVTRRTLDGRHPDGWVPAQKITVEEAVRAYTLGSAFAEFQETVKGTITPGKLADLVLLDRDIFRVEPGEIERAKVVLTLLDGQVVYEASR
jgi:hypothetical protein